VIQGSERKVVKIIMMR